MPSILVNLFIMLLGCGMLAVAWIGYKSGVLPAGSRGLEPYRPNRDDNPIAFHFFLGLYVCFGLWLIVIGVHAILGLGAPIPLR